MKKYIFGLLAVAFSVVAVSFTTADGNKDKFVCSWFLYDDPNISVPANDFPSTLNQATNPANYVEVTQQQAIAACDEEVKICAICAEKDVAGQPILTSGQAIFDELDAYFQQADETLRNPSTLLVKEKFEF